MSALPVEARPRETPDSAPEASRCSGELSQAAQQKGPRYEGATGLLPVYEYQSCAS
jgi:hypothetical protein